MPTIFVSKKWEIERENKRKIKRVFYVLKLHLCLAGYPVSGKLIGRPANLVFGTTLLIPVFSPAVFKTYIKRIFPTVNCQDQLIILKDQNILV